MPAPPKSVPFWPARLAKPFIDCGGKRLGYGRCFGNSHLFPMAHFCGPCPGALESFLLAFLSRSTYDSVFRLRSLTRSFAGL